MTTSLSFNEISLVPFPVKNDNQTWLRSADIARALGYKRPDILSKLYNNNADEFTPDMTQLVEIVAEHQNGVADNLSEGRCRIFSLRGCHLLAMFSRTPVAKAFRKWVLDVLDRMAAEESALPHGDTLTPSEQSHLHAIVSAKAGMLPADMQRKVRSEIWTRFNRHFRIARYAQLPPAKMGEAVEYLVGMEVKAAVAALPSGKQKIAESPIHARVLDQFPKDMGTGRKQALKKIEGILKDFYGLRDTVRLFTHPSGYSMGRSLSEKEQYEILLNLYRAADANLAAAYNALEAGYRLGRIQTTATTYAHVTPGGQKRAADLLPSLVQFGAEKSPHDDS